MSTGISSLMLKKITDFIYRRKPADITPAEAQKIQKSSYVLNHTEVKKRFSPAYITIAQGLNSSEKQLFECTAWYLSKIAQNKPKFRFQILDILNQKATDANINPDFREYLKKQIQIIKEKNN